MTWVSKGTDASLPQGPRHEPLSDGGEGKPFSEDTPRNRSAPDLGLHKYGSNVFEIGDLYRVKKLMGQGAFGCVVAGEDAQTGVKVAIKKVKGSTSDRTGAKRLLRELRFLRELRGHANIVNLQDVFVRASEGHMDTYIITDLMEADLEQIIKSSQALSTEHVRCLTYQMLNGLRHMHRAGVVHRDLKPANLVVDSQCRLKICDLGLSRHISDNVTATEAEDKRFTDYVVTRWYRAPELLLGARRYSARVDTWAAGCILGELIGRRPLFAGNDTSDMLVKLCAKLSPPSERQLSALTQDSAARAFVTAIPRHAEYSWAAAFPQADAGALGLMAALLEWVPADRLSVEQALEHPFMAALNDRPPARAGGDSEEELALVSQRGLPIETVTDLILLEASHARSTHTHALAAGARPPLVAHTRAAPLKCTCGQVFGTPLQLLSHMDPAFTVSVQEQRRIRQARAEQREREGAKGGHQAQAQHDCRAANSLAEGVGGDVTMVDTYVVL